jgi:hypothetical protein
VQSFSAGKFVEHSKRILPAHGHAKVRLELCTDSGKLLAAPTSTAIVLDYLRADGVGEGVSNIELSTVGRTGAG